MTFEEFFKKKRIDLIALEKGEPALFFEFKKHFEQMGEKSFDHTKKYWFNNLRKIYHLAAEIKTEKPKIENQLAEQTVTDSLTESAEPTPAPKLGFVPKFRAGATKPAEEAPAEEKKEEVPTAPKPGFTPRFKTANIAKSADAPVEEKKAEEAPVPTTPKPGFTPRFKAGVTKPAESAPEPSEEKKEETPAPAAPKLGFKPKFKPSTPPKPEGE